jgi:3'(2'), 5'-bisphosphate nucleotidase
MNNYEHELQVAIEAAEKAGRLILDHYARFEPIPDAPSSISTDADKESQEIILQHLRQAFPDDALCAEEATPTLENAKRHGSRIWIVDPIDGTAGFAQKNGEFVVMIALVVDGSVAVGVVFEPATWTFTFARRGAGCWRRGPNGDTVRCHVSATDQLGDATHSQSRSRAARTSPIMSLFSPARLIETFSAGRKLSLVAHGDADIYVLVYKRFFDWDICAGHILVEEAGGRVTDLHGNTIQYCREDFAQVNGLVASNSILHSAAIDRLKELPE